MRCRRSGQGERGFTLLETLTALTILSFALVSLLQSHQTSHRAARSAQAYSEARLLAQSLLASSTNPASERPREAQGRSGPFTWSIEVLEPRASWAELKTEAGWRLYHIRVRVAWERGRRVELNTLKLAAGSNSRSQK